MHDWSPLRRFVFRFGFIYWTLFCTPLALGILPIALGTQIHGAWLRVCAAVAGRVLHVEGKVDATGSGDMVVDWVSLALFAIAALAGAAIWSALARRREYERLRAGMRVAMRYIVAFTMLNYGVLKLFGGQFPPPNEGRLLQRVGDMSPMGLLWTFMGASPAYVVFSGFGETLGSVLLLWRRTATPGALILGAVLTNILMLNLCYDVPVKINSAHYLAMCAYIAAPDLRRIVDALAPPAEPRRAFLRVLKGIAIAVVGASIVIPIAQRQTAPAGQNWLEGYWKVTRFVRNGQDLPALTDDNTRWARLRFQTWNGRQMMRWHFSDGSVSGLYEVALDEIRKNVTLTAADDPAARVSYALALDRPDVEHIKLAGKVAGDDVTAEAARLTVKGMRLTSRGFHFVSEEPFNR